MTNKRILMTASMYGAIAVILGAFGAHGLKKLIDEDSLQIWAKGVEYQFYHVFALLFLAQFGNTGFKLIKWCFWFFTIGILFFSGSLYLLAVREVLSMDFLTFVGPITPIGGLLLILGWLTMFLTVLKNS